MLAFSVIYDWRLHGKVLSLSSRLPRIGQAYEVPDDKAVRKTARVSSEQAHGGGNDDRRAHPREGRRQDRNAEQRALIPRSSHNCGMKTYLVGGAVRDRLLGIAVKDRDYVVVGARVQDMLNAGYKPVGKDFPVFLQAQTNEEYALARTERKTGRGYHGFAFHADPEVTLEEDLRRRDLTINAIAEDETGALIDPFDGARDLDAKLLRHVSAGIRRGPRACVARRALRRAVLPHAASASPTKPFR